MTTEAENNNNEQVEQQEVDYKSLAEQLKAQLAEKESALSEKEQYIEAIAQKKNELLAEKKREQLEKAKLEGDWEALVKDAQEKEKQWSERYNSLQQQITQEKTRQYALRLASKMNPLDEDARETIADYLEKQIKYEDGKVMYLDNEGKPSVSNEDSFIKEQSNRNKFKPLLRGSMANGGGATGSKVVRGPLKAWNQMSEIEKTELYKTDVELYRQLRDQAKNK